MRCIELRTYKIDIGDSIDIRITCRKKYQVV